MKRNNLHSFVRFGTGFRFLQNVKNGWSFQKLDDDSGYIRKNIDSFLEFIEENQMKVTMNASHKLKAFRGEIVGRVGEDSYRISVEEAKELRDIIKELRIVVMSEAKEITAFFPTEKRYNIDSLYEDIGLVFGRNAYDQAPDLGQQDFDEAGKCIVLERGTSAAFHLMRGSECTIKQLYLSIVKRGRSSTPMWANMVAKLDSRGELDAALKGTLDNARRGFRNPVAHPEKFFSVEEAQDLLGTTTQLVGLLTSHPKYDRTAR